MKKFTFLAGVILSLCCSKLNAQLEIIGKDTFGRMFEITYSIKEPNTLYAITTTNHILVSHNNGVSWEVFYSLVSDKGRVSKMNISKDGSFLSFSTFDGKHGELHILDLLSKTITKTFIMPNYEEEAYVASFNFFENDTNTLVISSQFPHAFGTANRVYTTLDGGVSWKEIYYSVDDNYNIITSEVAFSPTDKNKIYIVNGNGNEEQDGGLLISTDGGDSFTEKLTGSVLNTMTFNPNNPNEIYIGTGMSFGGSPEHLHHSTDGGDTWENENITWGTNGVSDYIIDIKFNPLDNKHIIVLEEDEIVSTKDGGVTWANVEYPYGNTDSYYAGTKTSFNPFKTGELFITGNYKPLFSTDNADKMTQIHTPFFNAAGRIDFSKTSTEKHLFYNVQYGGVHRNLTNNTENSYDIKPLSFVTANNSPVYFPDAKTEGRLFSFISSLVGSSLKLSDNFGTSFKTIYTTFTNGLTNVIADPQVANQVWLTYDNWEEGLLEKVNFNDQNNVISTNISLPSLGIVNKILHPNNISDEFFVLINEKIYKTINGGDTWTEIILDNPGVMIFDIVQNQKNPDQLALGTSNGIFTSLDRGNTWNQVSNFETNHIAFSDINPGVIVATTYTSLYNKFAIHYSTDNATTWKNISQEELLFTESNGITVDFSDKNASIYIASFDLGILKYNLNLDVLSTVDVSTEKASILVYPNPAVDVVYIESKNMKNATIYDMAGKKLLESTTNKLNVSALPKGVYIIKIVTSDNKIFGKKFIKK